MGLHKRYADLLGSKLPSVTLANSPEDNYRIQARKWASIISDPELRELAEEAAELVLRKGFDLPEIVEKDLGKRRNGITLASYQSGVFPKIYINTNKQIKKLGGIKKIREAAVERGWSSQPNTILHELAHHMDYVMQENYRSTKPGDLFDKLDEEQVKKILSEYGSSEPAEFRAELYAAILAGKTFPKEFLEAAYLTTYPDDRTHILYQMGSGEIPNVSMLEREFGNMMEALFTEDGASLRIDILAKDEVQGFIQSHADILGTSLATAEMSGLMRSRLEESNYIFSGIKAFHELNEAFPSLLDGEGKRKPFEQFLNDVQSIDQTYNKNYLNAEYNFAQASAEMAGKWEQFTEDGDGYLLQYRTANDSKVRPEHAELHGITLPTEDSFWDEYFPPNGWNCRCTVIQVLKSKFEETPHSEAMQRAEQALQQDKKGMFHFNPGKTGKSFPDYNPYTLRRCNSCDVTKLNLTADVIDNDICAACRIIKDCSMVHRYNQDSEYKDRLLISVCADQREIEDNTTAARVLLEAFPDLNIKIRPHILKEGIKNPEYEIDGLIADRKGVESEQGIKWGFIKAKEQGCRAVVIDLDMHMSDHPIRPNHIAKYLNWRKPDFDDEIILECYVIYHGKAVRITKEHDNRDKIRAEIEKLKS